MSADAFRKYIRLTENGFYMDKMRDKMPKRIVSVICALCLVAAVCAALVHDFSQIPPFDRASHEDVAAAI